jgi:SsrA-binding protein
MHAMAQDRAVKGSGYELVAENRKARHDFFVEEAIECGIVLVGTEVKALRAHKVNLRNSYARIKRGEVFLTNVHIGAYAPAGRFGHEEERERKLLMHRREISRLWGKVRERGYSLVPMKIYFKHGRVKVELALVKGKRLYDKRAVAAQKQTRREIERELKRRNP